MPAPSAPVLPGSTPLRLPASWRFPGTGGEGAFIPDEQ
jgi:hypothetical protein